MSRDGGPVAIVGAGPTGIACGAELSKRGIASVLFDRGAILESVYRYPEEMVWFSTREQLSVAGVPFSGPAAHPTRLETLAYYREVARAYGLAIEPQCEVHRVHSRPDGVELEIDRAGKRRTVTAPAAILATGFFANPRRLGVPGEDLPHVSSRYVSGHPYYDRDVIVVGGKNSAAEAALDLYRHGARVTMVVLADALSARVKYWILPDLENRIAAGSIRAFFQSRVTAISPTSIRVSTPDGNLDIAADAVFPMIGYEPDFGLLERSGLPLDGEDRVPRHDPETMESSVPGIYVAGPIAAGTRIGAIFIEQGRVHAERIAARIAGTVREALSTRG